MEKLSILKEPSDEIKQLVGEKVLLVILGGNNRKLVDIGLKDAGDSTNDRWVCWVRNQRTLSAILGEFQSLTNSDTHLSPLESKLSAVLAFSIDLNKHITASIPADNTLSEQELENKIGDLFTEAEAAEEAAPQIATSAANDTTASNLPVLNKTSIITGPSDEYQNRFGQFAVIVVIGENNILLATKASQAAGIPTDPRWVLWVTGDQGFNHLLTEIGQLDDNQDLLNKLNSDPSSVLGFSVSFDKAIADIILSSDTIDAIRIEDAFNNASF